MGGIPARAELRTGLTMHDSVYGGASLGHFPLSSWVVDDRVDDYVVWKTLSGVVPITDDNVDNVVPGHVVKLWDRDDRVSPIVEAWTEYRLVKTLLDERAGTISFQGNYWLHELNEDSQLLRNSAAEVFPTPVAGWVDTYAFTGTFAELLVDMLPGMMWASALWDAGTVTPTVRASVNGSGLTCLAAMQQWLADVERVTGVRYQLSARPNGGAGIYLDVTVYGGATVLDVRTRKNLGGFRVERSRLEQATYIQFSSIEALRFPTYKITTVSAGAYIEVEDLLGDIGPAIEADQWDTVGAEQIVEWKNGTSHNITSTVKVSDTVTRFGMASTAGMAAGEYVFISHSGFGYVLNHVPRPSLMVQAPYQRIVRALPHGNELTNLAGVNADQNDWTGADPTGWSHLGTTAPVKETGVGYTQFGGWSLRAKIGGASPHVLAPARTAYVPTGYYVATTVWFRADAVGVGDVFRFTNPQTGASEDVSITSTIANAGEYTSYTKTWLMTTSAAKTWGCRLISVTENVYWDAVSYTVHPTGQPSAVDFILGSGAAKHIAAANRALLTIGEPVSRFEAELADLSIINPNRHGDDRPELGATVNLTSARAKVSAVPLRLVRLRRSSDKPAEPTVELSSLPNRLTRALR
jgi:hypothetical protein